MVRLTLLIGVLGGALSLSGCAESYQTSAADCAATGAAIAGGAQMLRGGDAREVVGSAILGAGAGAVADNVGAC